MTTAVKQNIKQMIRRGLGWGGFTKPMLKDTVSIFVYHEISENPSRFCEQYNLNIKPKLFAEQMDFIKDHFHVIDPDQLLEGDFAAPAALITFDDGTPGYFHEAVPIMAREGIPSIIFLNMAPIEGELFWSGLITYLTEHDPDFIKVLHDHAPAQAAVPDFLLCDSNIVRDYIESIDFAPVEEKIRAFYGPFAGLSDLDAVRDNPLVFFGNHLYNHYNAAKLSDDELRQQYLLNDQKILHYPNGRSYFAYPFGQPNLCFTDRQTELLRSLGAKAVFSSSGRVNRRGQVASRYDRIGIDASIKTVEDLFGLIQWMNLKTSMGRN
ncbi:MAG: hypothetical protein A3C36_01075 [Omnitrophica WOR_2 bacterium RIFCSPHIGHO2_02_FULL_52_10]|nr:MAG: hypothetical protein A3C36_01075 [Omnitrophica WOR_2 bacterium RIFCSPHIGHO2_02_FULL_52_10]